MIILLLRVYGVWFLTSLRYLLSVRDIMMAMLHHCSIPLARVVVRPSPRTRAAISFATASSPPTTPPSQVLLGLSENDLQKLAIDFGQVNFFPFSISLHYRIIQFNSTGFELFVEFFIARF